MNRQYIGARYVPKFADPIAWDKNNSYEALTVVTYLNNSYTSKKPVPVGVEITDGEYWVVTGNYNAQVEEYRKEVDTLNSSFAYFVREPENTDITDLLIDKLKNSNVILDGKKYTIRPFTIPNYRHIYGNGSLLIVNGDGEVAITVGTERSTPFTANYVPAGISDVSIDCRGVINGIFDYGQDHSFTGVSIYAPKEYGFKIGDENVPTDCNINFCNVWGNVCDYGFILNGTDNYLTECRTLFCRKASFQMNGGGNYVHMCHALGVTSDKDGYENCSSFEVHADAIITNCYCDNTRYGVYAPTANNNIVIDGLYCLWYEFNKNIERVAITINGGANARIENVVCDNSNENVTRLKIENFLQWAPMSNFGIKFDVFPSDRYNSNDASFLAEFNRNNSNFMSAKLNGYNVICGYKSFYSGGQSNNSCNFDIISDAFTIMGVSVRATIDGSGNANGLYTVNKGVLTADSVNNAKIDIALLRYNNDLFLAYKIDGATIDYNANTIIRGGGANCMYVPRDGVNLENATVIASYSLEK